MRKIPPALVLAVVLTLAVGVSPALAGSAVHQVTNAGNDPFAACAVNAGGINYTRSEVEPFGSVNPTDPSNIVTVFQQDRWSNGGAHGLAAGVSFDGGSSWTIGPLPFSKCASNAPAKLQYERASDPWVSFGPGTPGNPNRGATAFAVSISFNQGRHYGAALRRQNLNGVGPVPASADWRTSSVLSQS